MQIEAAMGQARFFHHRVDTDAIDTMFAEKRARGG